MEDSRIFGVIQDDTEVKITLVGLPRTSLAIAAVFQVLAAARVAIRLAEQRAPMGVADRCDVVFTVDQAARQRAVTALAQARDALDFHTMCWDEEIARVSLLSADMRSQSVVTARLLAALDAASVRFELVSLSADEVSLIIGVGDVERAMKAVRARFGPDVDPVYLTGSTMTDQEIPLVWLD